MMWVFGRGLHAVLEWIFPGFSSLPMSTAQQYTTRLAVACRSHNLPLEYLYVFSAQVILGEEGTERW